ncbi:MAG: acyltransferase [Pseudomonadota bacterium]
MTTKALNGTARPEKIDVLTTLRFFASLLIVFQHSLNHFAFTTSVNDYFPTYQALSFFFILSGFILTYVYRDFNKPGSLKRFFVARVARIWPLHVTIVFVLLFKDLDWYAGLFNSASPIKEFWGPFFANLFLLQAWVPVGKYYWSFNAASWSIAVDVAFYLLFPFIIYRLSSTWKIKTVMAFMVSFGVVVLCFALNVPMGQDTGGFGYFGLICISPLVRLFECVFGVAVAQVYFKYRDRYNPGGAAATLIESTCLVMIFVGMYLNLFYQSLVIPWLGGPGKFWVDIGTFNIPVVGLFILVMAFGKGRLAGFLSRPFLVMLGELSFAIYLLHQVLIRQYAHSFEPYVTHPWWAMYGYFWAVLLFGAYVTWRGFETPCRKFIINLGNGYGMRGMGDYFKSLVRDKSFVLPCMMLIFLIVPAIHLQLTMAHIRYVEKSTILDIRASSDTTYREIRFGEDFLVHGIRINRENSLNMTLAWESLARTELKYIVAVHFLDDKWNIVSQADYYQTSRPDHKDTVEKGAFWLDRINLSNLPGNVRAIGIALFNPGDMTLLPVNSGPRDWDNKRLIITLPGGTDTAGRP